MSTPSAMTASTSSGSTPGSATKIRSSSSVSSTSVGGSQFDTCGSAGAFRLKNCRCMRSARASCSMASDSIQLTGSLDDIRFLPDAAELDQAGLTICGFEDGKSSRSFSIAAAKVERKPSGALPRCVDPAPAPDGCGGHDKPGQ